MRTLRLNADDPACLKQAVEILRHGGLVAFPTETVYGLGANALDAVAVQKIFTAKDRPSWDPLIVHIASPQMLHTVAASLPRIFDSLARKFMPGPLTLLLPRALRIPDLVTSGRDKIAVRMPRHDVALELIRQCGFPLAAPSANRFGHTSPTAANHVLEDLDGRIDAVLDGGECEVGVESTVLDVTAVPPLILRQGGITREQLEELLGHVDVFRPKDQSAEKIHPSNMVASQSAPGMSERHYAPQAIVLLVEGNREKLSQVLKSMKGKVGLLAPTMWPAQMGISGRFVSFDWGPWNDWHMLAHRLYNGLRWLDNQKVDVIIAPLPPEEGLGAALRDRLMKAAKPQE